MTVHGILLFDGKPASAEQTERYRAVIGEKEFFRRMSHDGEMKPAIRVKAGRQVVA